MLDKTSLFDVNEFKVADITQTLNEVYEALQEKGYNPINQMVGYLISGDPGYISSHKGARSKILSLERSEIVSVLLKDYLKDKWDI